MTFSMYTLGCKLNQCESEAIADAFTKEGFMLAESGAPADIYIINTCTVTGKAEQKARRMIRKYASEPQRPIVITTGCYAQMDGESLAALDERVVVIPLDKKSALLHLPAFLASHAISGTDALEAVRSFAHMDVSSDAFDYKAISFSFHSRAFLKIQDGCDNLCAYCRVTLARGDAVSLDVDEVITRCKALEHQGYPEIVLTGVNITAYNSRGVTLGALVQRLLDELGSSMRVRLSSLEPDRLDDSLLSSIADPRVQSHFHLPIQSASDNVLVRCNRHYDVTVVSEAITQLRKIKNDPFIAADLITGLPGEDTADFEATVKFVKDHDLSQLHVFPFSPRPQTALFAAKDRVPESVRDERAKVLRDLSVIHYRRYIKRQLGKEVEVILEKHHKDMWHGLTGNYIKVQCIDVPEPSHGGMQYIARLEQSAMSGLPIARILSPVM
ncbi:MAG: tRNA (N(6)-L-threonylcarbamoyladenosine(37)-C(2))-methylthiotransferase MtaB [Sphaerochaetaceae bacterium]|nr:tRNA (N(6)-L-threonylcarbamoyladenosine(37)-C(2))-methylthiotransferase MtaB [Sphaerochaetaceae bacterium]NLO60576.1 tRNA (N(6)-L-threonylcarbamoyladenosine(37)-C(2))-methylthiotransferase MtaB [Spirochaetales bacterium]MDD2405014.1 tRNA (N(6)-L-threonylcarbamoyladenosine(37)-C(2))-methylthiotransferase MtaB [Sphaerochaetaceae bacterium]MDD4259516.1 tRNA (N(6)-L-threonylcarbamoyladenosine(37)-C(2))-methylthiotransferase MtaB [Sphaerochaetaceae bacterium]MDD4841648.1 tRNA (N(6)-L-threonylcarb